MHRIFVYGSLRAGFGNHRLLKDSRYIGEAVTAPQYTMLHLGGFPGVVADGQTSIVGEVYEVDHDTLRLLDRLEGHPNFYARTPIEVARVGNTDIDLGPEAIDAEVYLLPQQWVEDGRNPIIAGGDWKNRDEAR